MIKFATLATFLMLLLIGCSDNATEVAREAATRNAEIVANFDWENTIPEEKLYLGAVDCITTDALCAPLTARLQAMADALASCTNSTSLCKSVKQFAASGKPILGVLPKGYATPMPTHPFYWSLKNPLLEARSSKFNYRMEVAKFWLRELNPAIYVLSVLLAIAGWKVVIRREIDKNERNFELRKTKEEAGLAQRKSEYIHRENRLRIEQTHRMEGRLAEPAERNEADLAEREEAELAVLSEAKAAAETTKIEAAAAAVVQENIKLETQAALLAAFRDKKLKPRSGLPANLNSKVRRKRQLLAALQGKSLTDSVGAGEISKMALRSERDEAVQLEARAALAAAFNKEPKM